MEAIFLAKSSRGTRRWHVGRLGVAILVLLVLGACGSSFWYGYHLAPRTEDPRPDLYAAAWQREVALQRDEVERAIVDSRDDLDALALRLGEMQARLVRLDALGSRLVDLAHLDPGEFDFDSPPARGGARSARMSPEHRIPDFLASLEDLASTLDDRAPKLQAVEGTLMGRKLLDEVSPSGRPTIQGWISSVFGWRNDPQTGKRAFHEGVDFAGRRGSDVVAVASGVVIWSGWRTGYGRMVEINHGGGFTTRYAHNSKNLVKVGDTVKKGQAIARMGATGNATGTHVHFEVLENGKAVNPSEFIHAGR